MNKRMKKKHLLEREVAELTQAINVQRRRIAILESIVYQNTAAVNKNFEELEVKVASNTDAIQATSEAIKIGDVNIDGKSVVKAIQKAALTAEKVKGNKLFSKNGKTILDVLTGKLKFKD